jgi:hypothetical protein
MPLYVVVWCLALTMLGLIAVRAARPLVTLE